MPGTGAASIPAEEPVCWSANCNDVRQQIAAQPCFAERSDPACLCGWRGLLRCVRKMPALEECLQRADDDLKLAGETDLVYARVALVELAAEFLELAEELARARERER